MITEELRESAVELSVIFENTSVEVLNKIPNSFKEFINNIKSKDYIFTYNPNKKLVDQDIKPKTRGLIALIYQNYLCDEKRRDEYLKKCNEYFNNEELKKRELYNPDTIFSNESQQVVNIEQQEPDNIALTRIEENMFTKLIKKLRSIFFNK